MRRIFMVLLAMCLMAAPAFAQFGSYPQPQTASAAGKPAPDFSLKDQNGNSFTLSRQRGAWVLLYFYRGYW